MISFTLPISLKIRGKMMGLTRNSYDFAHHTVKTEVKRQIRRLIAEQTVDAMAIDGKYKVLAVIHLARTNQDMSNFFDVILKIATDTVVELGYLQGDSVKHLTEEKRVFISIDKENPRCTVYYAPNLDD